MRQMFLMAAATVLFAATASLSQAARAESSDPCIIIYKACLKAHPDQPWMCGGICEPQQGARSQGGRTGALMARKR